jgi:protein TonB
LIPPPEAPPPPPAPASRPQAIIAKYTVPTAIPKSIPPPDSDAPPVIDRKLVSSIGIGIPGRIPGRSPSGILNSVLGKQLPLPPPPKPVEVIPVAKTPSKPIFVGGDVQAAKLIRSEPAVYPDLALKAHISGVVLLRITVDEEGKVSDIKVISGHPLLVPAAVHAVSRWEYSPTLLNGRPVSVIATVAVNFSLQ